MNGKLITLEGINGMGKSYYFNKLKEIYSKEKVIFNSEINDKRMKGTSQKIFDILIGTESRFFDLNNPKLETLLIAAKQANDEEYLNKYFNENKTVISDRDFDTICLTEALMFYKKYNGNIDQYIVMLYETLKNFNRVPDKTILLIGDKDLSIKRAEKRDKKPYSEEELFILRTLYDKYIEYANVYKDRFVIINVDDEEEKVIKKLTRIINKVI